MISLKRFSFALAFCFAASVSLWGQTPGAAVVYVATGGPQIFAVTTDGTASPLISTTSTNYNSSAHFTSLTVGPDNTSGNTSNSDFFLYACDAANNTIIRLEVSTSGNENSLVAGPNFDTVYSSATPLSAPVCGRVNSRGDLYVSSGTAGSGVYEINGVSTTGVGGTFTFPPTLVYGSSAVGSSFTGGGITQKDNGDMLVLDTADNSILYAAFLGDAPSAPFPPSCRSGTSSASSPFCSTLSSYVTTGLGAPIGIARLSTNEFFVLNQGSSKPKVANGVIEINPANLSSTMTCASSPGGTNYSSLAASEDNFVYFGVNAGSSNKQEVEVYSGSDCAGSANNGDPVETFSLAGAGPPLGIAVPPVSESPVATGTSSTFDSTTGITSSTYNFGFTILKTQTESTTSTPQKCTPTVSQQQVPIYYLNTLLDSVLGGAQWYGGTAIPYNGEGGFGTLYTLTAPSGCAMADVANAFLLAASTDATRFTNPRIIECDPDSSGSLTCAAPQMSGFWPVGGLLPNDWTGSVTRLSEFFLANGYLSNPETGTFCGFESPLPPSSSSSDPAIVSSNNLSVKFKLALATSAPNAGNCSNGPYIKDATALLSVEQVADGTGAIVFNPITVNTQGNSAPSPPIFKYNSNSSNYQFSLNLKGYQSGTYALIVTLLSANPLTGQPNNQPYVVTYIKIP